MKFEIYPFYAQPACILNLKQIGDGVNKRRKNLHDLA